MINLEKWQSLFPMAYLILATAIAVACHLLKIPETVSGLLVGAALTRVKMPTKVQKDV
jgi:hypothetical protein